MLRFPIFLVLLKLCLIRKLIYEIPRAFERSLNIKFWMIHNIQAWSYSKICLCDTKDINLVLFIYFSDTRNMEHLNSATALFSSKSQLFTILMALLISVKIFA